MTCVELMVASVLLVLASSLSAQIWGEAGHWARRLEARQALLLQIDAALLQQDHGLRQQAALAQASAGVSMACTEATDWMAFQLNQAAGSLPPVVVTQVLPGDGATPGALWLVLSSPEHRIERRRLFMAAAHGLCLPASTDTEVGA